MKPVLLINLFRRRFDLEYLDLVSSPRQNQSSSSYNQRSDSSKRKSLETLLGIVAACLPTIRPLLKTQLIKSYLSKYSSTGLPKRRHAGVRGSDRQDPLGYKGSSNLSKHGSTSGVCEQ